MFVNGFFKQNVNYGLINDIKLLNNNKSFVKYCLKRLYIMFEFNV